MKTFLTTTFAILLFTVTCKAQWTAGAGTAYLTNITDKLGVGTTVPGSKLHVLENDALTGSTAGVTIEQSGTGNSALNFLLTGVQRYTMGIDNGDADKFKIGTVAGFATGTLLTMDNTGNVGIGTTAPSPTVRLNILGTAEGLRLAGAGTTGVASMSYLTFYDSNNATARGTFGDLSATNLDIYLRGESGSGLNFGTDGAVGKMYLNTAGYLGIGTTNPLGQLDVRVATDQHIQFLHNTNGAFTGAAGIVSINDANTTYTPLGFYASQYYFGNGSVGIGTKTPDSKLTVNGKIHSTEVLVDLLITGPDYVFKKNYNLPSLADVKAYTDKNHHLPGVPAAAEMEKNGINVGEMNMTLLKKVEELTLYLIELNKTITAQQKEIEQLKKKN